ncbi:hypothetical protein NYB23_004547 [Salmonella enterica]|nr:hypothetical protein [Salmonella enterica]EKL9720581.1 hypothetical protein [Escherichia coli]
MGMESIENQQAGERIGNSYKLSWLAYIRPVVVLLVLLAVASAFGVGSPVSLVIAAVALALFVYQVLYLRSVVLYTDDDGVWCYAGILPWNKGMVGVKWRDVEDAVFYTGFVSWAFNSYAVRIGHRFTKTSELYLRHVRFGRAAVEHINELHRSKLVAE